MLQKKVITIFQLIVQVVEIRKDKISAKIIAFALIRLSFLCSMLIGCKQSTQNIDDVIRNIQQINLKEFSNKTVFFRSHSSDDSRIIVSEYDDDSIGFFILSVGSNCEVFKINKEYCKDPNMFQDKTLNYIGSKLCDLDIEYISIDTCQNIYFSVNDSYNLQYVLVKNHEYLDKEYHYLKYRNNCFKMTRK